MIASSGGPTAVPSSPLALGCVAGAGSPLAPTPPSQVGGVPTMGSPACPGSPLGRKLRDFAGVAVSNVRVEGSQVESAAASLVRPSSPAAAMSPAQPSIPSAAPTINTPGVVATFKIKQSVTVRSACCLTGQPAPQVCRNLQHVGWVRSMRPFLLASGTVKLFSKASQFCDVEFDAGVSFRWPCCLLDTNYAVGDRVKLLSDPLYRFPTKSGKAGSTPCAGNFCHVDQVIGRLAAGEIMRRFVIPHSTACEMDGEALIVVQFKTMRAICSAAPMAMQFFSHAPTMPVRTVAASTARVSVPAAPPPPAISAPVSVAPAAPPPPAIISPASVAPAKWEFEDGSVWQQFTYNASGAWQDVSPVDAITLERSYQQSACRYVVIRRHNPHLSEESTYVYDLHQLVQCQQKTGYVRALRRNGKTGPIPRWGRIESSPNLLIDVAKLATLAPSAVIYHAAPQPRSGGTAQPARPASPTIAPNAARPASPTVAPNSARPASPTIALNSMRPVSPSYSPTPPFCCPPARSVVAKPAVPVATIPTHVATFMDRTLARETHPEPLASVLGPFRTLSTTKKHARGVFDNKFDSEYKMYPHYWDETSRSGNMCIATNLPSKSIRELMLTDAVYHDVAFRFRMGLGINRPENEFPLIPWKIDTIRIVCNKPLFNEYTARRDTMLDERGLTKDGGCTCRPSQYPECKTSLHEEWVWHGCSAENALKIAETGPLRDYNTGQQHGSGVYFARYSYYCLFEPNSANAKFHSTAKLEPSNRFTPIHVGPDGRRRKTIILARLLVGESRLGSHGMKAPPASRFKGSNALCDTMTDGPWATNKMFVASAGSDKQAYPQFIVDLVEQL